MAPPAKRAQVEALVFFILNFAWPCLLLPHALFALLCRSEDGTGGSQPPPKKARVMAGSKPAPAEPKQRILAGTKSEFVGLEGGGFCHGTCPARRPAIQGILAGTNSEFGSFVRRVLLQGA